MNPGRVESYTAFNYLYVLRIASFTLEPYCCFKFYKPIPTFIESDFFLEQLLSSTNSGSYVTWRLCCSPQVRPPAMRLLHTIGS
jgi:hypothetical protein